MYVDTFIPYHMYVCMYVCMYVNMYVNMFTVCDIRIHRRAGPAVSCILQLLLQRTEACSYAALIGLAAAIRRLLRTGLAAVVHSHPRT